MIFDIAVRKLWFFEPMEGLCRWIIMLTLRSKTLWITILLLKNGFGAKASVRIKGLRCGSLSTKQPELFIMNWVSSDSPSHNVECSYTKCYIWDQAKADPESTSKLNKKETKFPWPLLPLQSFLFLPLHLWTQRESSYVVDGERESSGLAHRCFCAMYKHHRNADNVTPWPLSRTTLKGSGKFLSVRRSSGGTPGCSFSLEG